MPPILLLVVSLILILPAIALADELPKMTGPAQCLTPTSGKTPAFFPDGKRLAYTEETDDGRRLMVLDLATNKSTRVGTIDDADRPAVSADGKWIAYAAGPEFARQVWIVRADQPKPQPLTKSPGFFSHPIWTDGGKRLVFSAGFDQSVKWASVDPFATPIQTKNLRPLGPGRPVFSLKGNMIALVTTDAKGVSSIKIVTKDGTAVATITMTPPSNSTVPIRGCYDPAFSPDERFLAYVRSDLQPYSDVYLRDMKTGQEMAITSDQADNQMPAFAPGGRSIAYVSIRGDKAHRIWMVKLEWEKKIPSPTADTKPSTPKQR